MIIFSSRTFFNMRTLLSNKNQKKTRNTGETIEAGSFEYF